MSHLILVPRDSQPMELWLLHFGLMQTQEGLVKYTIDQLLIRHCYRRWHKILMKQLVKHSFLNTFLCLPGMKSATITETLTRCSHLFLLVPCMCMCTSDIIIIYHINIKLLSVILSVLSLQDKLTMSWDHWYTNIIHAVALQGVDHEDGCNIITILFIISWISSRQWLFLGLIMTYHHGCMWQHTKAQFTIQCKSWCCVALPLCWHSWYHNSHLQPFVLEIFV